MSPYHLMVLASSLVCSGCCCSGFLFDDDVLENAERDLEAAMFAFLAPGATTVPHPEPEIEALIVEHTATVVGGYLDQAHTPERIRGFVESSDARCAQLTCETWRTEAVERLRGRLDSGGVTP